VFQLNISDWIFTASAKVSVTVGAGDVPTAVAEAPPGGFTGGLVTLNGSASHDPMGLPLTYTWKQMGGPTVKLSQADTVLPSFEPSEAGSYKFQLVVSNGTLTSAPATVTVGIAAGGGGCSQSGPSGWLAVVVLLLCAGRLRPKAERIG
jgi:hypothetical protein